MSFANIFPVRDCLQKHLRPEMPKSRSRCCYGHFTIPAVEMQGELLAVVQEEQLAGKRFFAGGRLFRAESEFVFDAVACAHQFRSGTVSQLKGLLGNHSPGLFIDLLGKSICNVGLI